MHIPPHTPTHPPPLLLSHTHTHTHYTNHGSSYLVEDSILLILLLCVFFGDLLVFGPVGLDFDIFDQ